VTKTRSSAEVTGRGAEGFRVSLKGGIRRKEVCGERGCGGGCGGVGV